MNGKANYTKYVKLIKVIYANIYIHNINLPETHKCKIVEQIF